MAAIDVTSRIEPGTVANLDRLAKWDLTSIATMRGSYAAAGGPATPLDPRVERSDAVIAGIEGSPDVRARWYRPAGAQGALPCLMWLHGGGYVMGTLDENDDRLDRLVVELGCAVVSVDWRLAPEHPYPAGLRDAETVWRRLAAEPAAFGVDPARLAVGGASAGGRPAAPLCPRLRGIRGPPPGPHLLVYPLLDDRELTHSSPATAELVRNGLVRGVVLDGTYTTC